MRLVSWEGDSARYTSPVWRASANWMAYAGLTTLNCAMSEKVRVLRERGGAWVLLGEERSGVGLTRSGFGRRAGGLIQCGGQGQGGGEGRKGHVGVVVATAVLVIAAAHAAAAAAATVPLLLLLWQLLPLLLLLCNLLLLLLLMWLTKLSLAWAVGTNGGTRLVQVGLGGRRNLRGGLGLHQELLGGWGAKGVGSGRETAAG